jgi:hypothetical protein
MTFVKTGDAQPIISVDDGEKQLICEKCHKPKTIIVVNESNNKLICECEIEETKLD